MEVALCREAQLATIERLKQGRKRYERFADWCYAVLAGEEEYDAKIASLAKAMLKHELPTIEGRVNLDGNIKERLLEARRRREAGEAAKLKAVEVALATGDVQALAEIAKKDAWDFAFGR